MKNRRIFAIFMAATIAIQTSGISTTVYGMDAEAYSATAGNAIQAVNPEVYQGENYQVEFHVDTQWQTGYNGRVTITNICEKAIDNWYLSFELADEIQNLQCGTIMEHEGNCYLIKNAGWNKDIPAGGSVSFTFTAVKTGENVIFPTEYSMDTALLEVPGGNYSTDFQVQSDWGSGFTSALVITNTSQETISDWKLMFSFAGEITNIGGGQLIMSENGLYELEAYSYDYGIAPGESRSIQIIGSREGTDVVPTNISLMTVEYYVPEENTVLENIPFEDSRLQEELDRMTAANGGTLPVIYLDEEDGVPCFISGRYSDTLVVDFESAVEVLHELTNLMDIDWETISFTPVHKKAYADRIFYRMQEWYEGMKVCKKEIILVTDEAGNVVTLSGDFDPIFGEDTTAVYSEEEAGVTAAAELGSIPGEGSLVWYSLERGYDEPAWYFQTDTQAVYISARYGDVLERCDTMAAMNPTVSNPSETPWEYDEERQIYLLTDSVRNIEVAGKETEFRAVNICEPNGTVNALNYNDEDIRWLSGISKWMEKDGSRYLFDVSYSQSGEQRENAAVRQMINAKELFDYYLQTLGIIGYDNQGSLLRIQYETGHENENNAHADTVNFYYYDTDCFGGTEADKTINEPEKKTMGVIHIGDTYYEQEQFLESIGHEYAHLMEAGAIGGGGLDMGRESGVIKEALADCFQELKDCYENNESWKNPSRDIKFMITRKRDTDGNYLEPMESAYTGERVNSKEIARELNNEKKNAHYRSMILSHAVYKMYDNNLASAEKMTEWLYRVLYYLPASATYVNLRCAMEEVAEDMGLDAEIVAKAMDNVGVKIKDNIMTGSNLVNYNIQVVDENEQPIQNAAVIYDSKYVYYTDENGLTEVSLRNKKTTLSVKKAGYEDGEIKYSVNDVNSEEYAQVRLKSKKRYQSEENRFASISGEVRDSENNTVPYATIVIREGAGAKYGRNIGTYTASNSGTYMIPGLPYGIYTLEVKKDGYITQYESVIVGNPLYHAAETIILTKSLSDDQVRVVLRWNAEPRDLDSHLVCYEDGVLKGHVYYMCRSASGISLDVDDMTGYGPETITYQIKENQEYEYYVHWYNGNGTWETSGAEVQLYQGDKQIREWNVNIGNKQNISGNIWNVFTMKDGEVQ